LPKNNAQAYYASLVLLPWLAFSNLAWCSMLLLLQRKDGAGGIWIALFVSIAAALWLRDKELPSYRAKVVGSNPTTRSTFINWDIYGIKLSLF
jgi:hypothetical protein